MQAVDSSSDELLSLSQEPEPPRDLVVVAAGFGGRISALKQVAHVARIDRQGFVVTRADHLTVTDIARPGRATEGHVARPRERVRAARLPGQPGAVEAVREPGTEVPMVVRGLIERLY